MFDKLNEVKGYKFLKSIGCEEVSFIPRSIKHGIETPDLKGYKNGALVLCEVKTKHVSDEFIHARDNSDVIRTDERLPEALEKLLSNTFKKAASQLNSELDSVTSEKYIYLNIEYDNESVSPHIRRVLNIQTRNVFNSINFIGIKLVIDNEG